jgi:transposase InsO family protein
MKADKKEEQVLVLVQAERQILSRLGTVKLYHQIGPQLQASSIKFGRDKLFRLLRERDMLIKPRRRYVQTTNSKHFLRMHPNLIKDLPCTRPEQIWVSDITYIKTDEGFCYLNMITDVWSRKIMGFAIAESMDVASMIKAYEMALKGRVYPGLPLIHHSDRGLQYCSHDYVRLSRDNGIAISMTENGDPYENALAERMNRTMKEEFGLGGKLHTRKQAYQLAAEGIELYNSRRPHLALQMKTPNEVHSQNLNLELPHEAEAGSAGGQPTRNSAANGNDAGATNSGAPAIPSTIISVAMPEKTHTGTKTKIPATEATGILS